MIPFARVFIITFFPLSFCLAQHSIPILYTHEPSRNTQIGLHTHQSIVYISLPDLLKAFKLKYTIDIVTGKTEFYTADYSVKVTTNNPFFIVRDKKGNENIVQLPFETRFTTNTFFVPLEPFIKFLDGIVSENVSFNKKRKEILVSGTTDLLTFDITGLTFEERENGYLIRIHSNKRLKEYDSWKKHERNNTWLYLTCADAKADTKAILSAKKPGFVNKILVFQSPTSVQLTINVKGSAERIEPLQAEENNDILLNVHLPTQEQRTLSPAVRDLEKELEKERNRWRLDCVVIDPGHGGDDPGTIGVRKTKEKDVTLAIAHKLEKLIKRNMPNVKVVLTRRTDEFVELYRRGQIANQAGGKLFLSIHCNSAVKKPAPANGFEIYLLRPGKTDAALRVAERENAVIRLEKGYEQRYQPLNEENFILLTMAQSAYVKYSELFADILQREMGKHLELKNNGVKQAGFYVLVGASMPNVLVETGYLSNLEEERFLKSSSGQQKIANAIFEALKQYKVEYEKTLEEGNSVDSR